MRKISSYLYPNRIQLLADVAGFTTEYTNVYQRNIKIYNGIDNTLEFDIKNADQKRIDLGTLSNIELNVMDSQGSALPNSPYTITPLDQTTLKGLASVVIPQDDLVELSPQYLKYSVSASKSGADVLLYCDSRFGAVGTIELVGDAMPTLRDDRVYDSFTAEIDLKGTPTYHSSAIPVKFYEAVKTATIDFDIQLSGLVGSIWIEGTKNSTINTEAFKNADFLWSSTYTTSAPGNGHPTIPSINVGDYQYFRVSYTTPISNGVGSSFEVHRANGAYTVTLRSGGTGYAVGSQMKVLGSVLGGVDVVNDMIISVTAVDASSAGFTSSYAVSSITSFTTTGTAAVGAGTYIVTGTNLTGTVDKITVS
jgi:hypothetical protein